MSVVYRARDPELDREVAIKLMRAAARSAMSDDAARARLVREAQALAQLSHPNVIAVHDVGVVGDLVFLAMELVEGPSLKEWLVATPRSRADILEVFRAAGAGLAAAHRADLIHRDFKPANVIVGNDGRVRVVDFGLARTSAEDDDSREGELPSNAPALPPIEQFDIETASIAAPGATAEDDRPAGIVSGTLGSGDSDSDGGSSSRALDASITRVGAILGTPRYMSPEQHRGTRAGAASDQFSFCVALFEALTGGHPFQVDRARPEEARDDVIAGRVVASTGKLPRHLVRTLKRGLAGPESDRFPSMDALLAALSRDPARTYRRAASLVAVAGAAAAIAALTVKQNDTAIVDPCAGGAARVAEVWNPSARSTLKSSFEATGRQHSAATLQRVVDRLDDFATDFAATHRASCEATKLRGTQSELLLDRSMACMGRQLEQVRQLVGLLGDADKRSLDRAVQATNKLTNLDACRNAKALARVVPLPESPEDRETLDELWKALARTQATFSLGSYKAALESLEPVVAGAQKLGHPPIVASSLALRAKLESALGDLKESEASFYGALEAGARAKDLELMATVWAELINLVGYRQARRDDALALVRPAELALLVADEPPGPAAALAGNLGILYSEGGETERSIEQLEKQVEIYETLHGPDAIPTGSALTALGLTLVRDGNYAKAAPTLERALRILESGLGEGHPNVAFPLTNLGVLALNQSDPTAAADYFERALRIDEAALGPDHAWVGLDLANLGAVRLDLGRIDEARADLERALAIVEAKYGDSHPEVGRVLNNLGRAFLEEGRNLEAEPLLKRALAVRVATRGAEHPEVARVHRSLATMWMNRKNSRRAFDHYGKALAILEKAHDAEHKDVASLLLDWGRAAREAGLAAEAVPLLERATSIMDSTRADMPPASKASVRFELAQALWRNPPHRGRAFDLATQANALLGQAGPSHADDKVAVTSWLAAHPVP